MVAANINQNAQMANQEPMEPNITTTQGQTVPTQTVPTQTANMQQAPTASYAPVVEEPKNVQYQWQKEYTIEPVSFEDNAPDLIDLSKDNNVITIDARAIVYKKTPFEEIINAEFKTYTSPNTGIEVPSDDSKNDDDEDGRIIDLG